MNILLSQFNFHLNQLLTDPNNWYILKLDFSIYYVFGCIPRNILKRSANMGNTHRAPGFINMWSVLDKLVERIITYTEEQALRKGQDDFCKAKPFLPILLHLSLIYRANTRVGHRLALPSKVGFLNQMPPKQHKTPIPGPVVKLN